ncbi:hypothetical protein F8568_020745 [Actinomadura sp. LD22]|uniref:Uncharacterized protein n=1 Tax=Actinomadura physcomitrii TaxID=2650748 RepID=A0A6I4MJE5_9ACTN|nr:hypothetical protein [Actinomadura physcomitrii]MWA02759.1 hypothetical protein [Actinomadura physcomitrii]
MTNRKNQDQHIAGTTADTNTGRALNVAERSFQLLTTGPHPLAVDGRAIGHGMPARSVDLNELRTLLLAETASDELKDAAWRALVIRARMGDPAWVIGCVGVAMPGLKATAAQVIRTSPHGLIDDIVSEMLTEFVAQLARIDLHGPYIAARLMRWARKGAFRARCRATRELPTNPCELGERRSAPDVDLAVLVRDAARQGIITPQEAELIVATRLDGRTVQDLAQAWDVAAWRLYTGRQAAEAKLAVALRDGRVSAEGIFPGPEM